ncbi:YqgE/AlgH family protein [Govanella unica]|uniref:UPF0301 protein NYP16_05220 n=1 Tax=Govanella unica TaxID=2975056 RepID=A0A9X3TWR4_9PROT|nr:YqgE/AlgH family protein [Govania unica]MDA5193356.1 YqgE/AlgH family protein [Govania unica]
MPMRKDDGYLTGQLLLAMPSMDDPRFARSVIYVCAHNADGAMGLVINRLNTAISFPELMNQLGIPTRMLAPQVPIFAGGPVEIGRGFVLHSADYVQETTLVVSETIALTATVDVLSAIAENRGPRANLIALGYAGWGPGQLENEMHRNGWLTVEADENLVFFTDVTLKWPRAVAKLGIDISMLSSDAGHA